MEILKANSPMARFALSPEAGAVCILQPEDGGQRITLQNDGTDSRQLRIGCMAARVRKGRLEIWSDSVNRSGAVRLIFQRPLTSATEAEFVQRAVPPVKAMLPVGLAEITLRCSADVFQAEYDTPTQSPAAAYGSCDTSAAPPVSCGNTLSYVAQEVSCMQGETDRLMQDEASLQNELERLCGEADAIRARVCEKETQLAQLRAEIDRSIEEEQRLDRQITEAEEMLSMRENTGKLSHLESLLQDLDISEDVLSAYADPNSRHSDESEQSMADRAAVFIADAKMLLRTLLNRRQEESDRTAAPMQTADTERTPA